MSEYIYVIPKLAGSLRQTNMPVIIVFEDGSVLDTNARKRRIVEVSEKKPIALVHLYESNRGRRRAYLYKYEKTSENKYEPKKIAEFYDSDPPTTTLKILRETIAEITKTLREEERKKIEEKIVSEIFNWLYH